MNTFMRNRHFLRHAISLLGNRMPGQIVIQYTDECNASCPQCGMRKLNNYPRSKLSGRDCIRIIDAAARSGVMAISFTGGEPLLYLDEIVGLLGYASMMGIPYTRTGTNGYLFMDPDSPGFEERVSMAAQKLSESGLYTFWISIDSWNPVLHENMRGLPGVIEGIRKALPVFHRYGVHPSANLGISKAAADLKGITVDDGMAYYAAFREGFRRFYDFAISLGFTIVNACYPMSVVEGEDQGLNAVYGATSTAGLMRFSDTERAQMFKALFDTIPEYRHRIRIFTPRCSLYSLYRDHRDNTSSAYPCRGGTDFFFIDARGGDTYPCGYRGRENLGKFWDLDMKTSRSGIPCRACDWECFRDPSEMIGPLFPLLPLPSGILKKLHQDREFMRLWLEDWRYYRACGFFNCTKAPDYLKMASFS
ncbi:MAG TPA: radical SAM protein [Desulfomonilia bacterium]|nr:radical SAM protein [Desulfomonilia bacterium]